MDVCVEAGSRWLWLPLRARLVGWRGAQQVQFLEGVLAIGHDGGHPAEGGAGGGAGGGGGPFQLVRSPAMFGGVAARRLVDIRKGAEGQAAQMAAAGLQLAMRRAQVLTCIYNIHALTNKKAVQFREEF